MKKQNQINSGIILDGGNLSAGNLAVGNKASIDARENSINQQINTLTEKIDFPMLQDELRFLRESLLKKAENAEHFISIGEVANAEKAIEEKDEKKIVNHLKSAGTWALDTARELGIKIATELVKKQIDL